MMFVIFFLIFLSSAYSQELDSNTAENVSGDSYTRPLDRRTKMFINATKKVTGAGEGVLDLGDTRLRIFDTLFASFSMILASKRKLYRKCLEERGLTNENSKKAVKRCFFLAIMFCLRGARESSLSYLHTVRVLNNIVINANLLAKSPYEGGGFKIELFRLEEYPMAAPKVYFLTKIYQPNTDKLGRICLDILKDKQSPALQIRTIFLSIQALLSASNPDDPLSENIAKNWKANKDEAAETAKERTRLYASGA